MDSKLPLAIVLAQPELPTTYFCVRRGMGFYQGKHEFLGFFTILFIYRTWQVSRGQEMSLIKEKYLPKRGDCAWTIMSEKGYCRESLKGQAKAEIFNQCHNMPEVSHWGYKDPLTSRHSLHGIYLHICNYMCWSFRTEYSLRVQDLGVRLLYSYTSPTTC